MDSGYQSVSRRSAKVLQITEKCLCLCPGKFQQSPDRKKSFIFLYATYSILKLIFWILIGLIAYTYFGYAILLLLLNGIKRLFFLKRKVTADNPLPEVTLLIAAYNEKDIIETKVQNTREIHYPPGLLKVVWITDGSDDGTPEILVRYPGIKVLHQSERMGKTAALNRAMKLMETPYVIFSDANTLLDPDAVMKLITLFNIEKVGCVAGEKRIARNIFDVAAGAGEGAYWQYESLLKRLESNFY